MDVRQLQLIDDVVVDAVCWGAELDLTYRVLALTVEPQEGRHPDELAGTVVDDRRLLLVLHPCNQIQAQLVHAGETVERFDVDQLVLVIDRLDGARLAGPVVAGRPNPLTGPMSLEGKADVIDGRMHVVLVRLAAEERTLTLRATFDEAELRRADGSVVELG